MLLDEKEPGLSGHGAIEEASTTHLSRDQRGDRTRYCQGGSEDYGGKAQSDVDRLGQLLLSRRRQQSLQCGRSTCPPEAASVVMRQTPCAATGLQTFSGSLSAIGVRSGAVTTPYREPFVGEGVSLFREPDAGNPPVRFDEREQETESSQTGLRGHDESPVNNHREATATAPVLDSTRVGVEKLGSKTCFPSGEFLPVRFFLAQSVSYAVAI